MKKKVLHVVEAFGGGIFSYLVTLVNATCEAFDITIAFARRAQTPENFASFFDKDVHFIELRHFSRNIDIPRMFQAGRELRGIVTRLSPDLVHLHSSFAGIIGRIALNCQKRPVLYTPHGFSFLMQEGSGLSKTFFHMAEWWAGRANALSVGVSRQEGEMAKTVARRATYINSGIPIKPQEPGRPGSYPEDSPPGICALGRITGAKDPALFNSIAGAMPQEHFTWIGDGELRGLLTAQNIHITGWMDADCAGQEMQRQDILLLPSIWEGLPIALLEAMMCGLVCITSDIAGTRDVIEDGRNGFVARSVQDYVRLIHEIRAGKHDLAAIRDQAWETVSTKFSAGGMARQYSALYLSEMERECRD